MDRADPMDVPFESIFKALPKDRFLERPESILSFMRDLGVDRSIIRMLDTIIQLDRRRFLMVMTCLEEDVEKQVRLISDDCFLREGDVSEIISSIRHALSEVCRSIGIYLGNERSCLCYRDINGELVKGNPISTSMFFDEDGIVIGGPTMSLMRPDCVVHGFVNGLGSDTVYKIKDVEYTPVALSSLFIRRLLEDHFGECGPDVGHVTIVIPPFSGKEGEDAICQAGMEAGLEDVRVMSEAVAASITANASCKEGILHLDKDGFAFTLIDENDVVISSCNYKSPCTGDWRQRSMDLILEKCPGVKLDCFDQAHLSMNVEYLMNSIDHLPIIFDCLRHGSQDTFYIVSRDEYLRKVEGLFESIREDCLFLMMSARHPFYEYDSISVVGDFPLRNMMTSVFQKKIPLDLRFLSYESIALGAALYDQK